MRAVPSNADANARAVSLTSAESKGLVAQTYLWLAAALALTAMVCGSLRAQPAWMLAILGASGFWALLLGVAAAAVLLRPLVARMPLGPLAAVLLGYALALGAVLGPVYWRYTGGSMATPCLVVATTLAALAMVQRVRGSRLSTSALQTSTALAALALATVVNFTVLRAPPRSALWVGNYAGVAVLTGLVIFDTPRVLTTASTRGAAAGFRAATMVYLDFVNIAVIAGGAARSGRSVDRSRE